MIELENTMTWGFSDAIEHMRDNGHGGPEKSDSYQVFDNFVMGDEDFKLSIDDIVHGKLQFLRFINVSVNITAPVYFFLAFSEYTSGKLICNTFFNDVFSGNKTIIWEDLTFIEDACNLKRETQEQRDLYYECQSALDDYLLTISSLMEQFSKTRDSAYFRTIMDMMPMGYMYTVQYTTNYLNLRDIYRNEKNSCVAEWEKFCEWIKSLPYHDFITVRPEDVKGAKAYPYIKIPSMPLLL